MSNLHAHRNVWEICLQLLEERGYSLRVEFGPEDDDPVEYWAERDGFSFSAWNPIELLGLTAIHDAVKPAQPRPYWWSAATTRSAIAERLHHAADAARQKREDALDQRRARDLEAFRAELEESWNEYGDVASTASKLGVRAEAVRTWLKLLGIET